jgi:hypothetical protein
MIKVKGMNFDPDAGQLTDEIVFIIYMFDDDGESYALQAVSRSLSGAIIIAAYDRFENEQNPLDHEFEIAGYTQDGGYYYLYADGGDAIADIRRAQIWS